MLDPSLPVTTTTPKCTLAPPLLSFFTAANSLILAGTFLKNKNSQSNSFHCFETGNVPRVQTTYVETSAMCWCRNPTQSSSDSGIYRRSLSTKERSFFLSFWRILWKIVCSKGWFCPSLTIKNNRLLIITWHKTKKQIWNNYLLLKIMKNWYCISWNSFLIIAFNLIIQ